MYLEYILEVNLNVYIYINLKFFSDYYKLGGDSRK